MSSSPAKRPCNLDFSSSMNTQPLFNRYMEFECDKRNQDDMERYPERDSIIEEQSRRQLTHRSDCLVVLEGLLSVIHERKGDMYILGVFDSELPKQLLLMVMDIGPTPGSRRCTSTTMSFKGRSKVGLAIAVLNRESHD